MKEKDNKLLISIIVPVYKVEPYLDRCVQSVIAQTYVNWELLLIDDDSPDNCPTLCDNWEQRDSRVHVFHNKINEGVSSARNIGLNNAVGDYITFVDSDDWLEKECLSRCIEIIIRDNLDALQFGYKIAYYNKIVKQLKGTRLIPVCGIKTFIDKSVYNNGVWGWFYKTSILQDNHVRFNINMKYHEDRAFVISALSYTKLVESTTDCLYNYSWNEVGVTKNVNYNARNKSLIIYASYKEKYPLFTTIIDSFMAWYILESLNDKKKNDNEIKDLFFKLKIDTRNLKSLKLKIFIYLANLNFDLTAKLLRSYYKVKKIHDDSNGNFKKK